MPIATFRGESSVGEIADKLFVRLTPRQREKAEAAILKANPQLIDLSSVREGSILRVPDIPELRPKTNRSLDNPDAQIGKEITDALSDYDKTLAARFKSGLEATKKQTAILKSAKFKRELTNAKHLQELAGQAGEALEKRAKTLKDQQKSVAGAIRQMISDLDKGLN